ncbi:MAG: outer membrane protein insertion porin family [Planctomycetota bacterium]|jgi:outer membrane protein insertion porin family
MAIDRSRFPRGFRPRRALDLCGLCLLLLLVQTSLLQTAAYALQAEAQTEAAEPEGIVTGIQIVGLHQHSEERIIAALGQKIGQRFDAKAFDRGTSTIWNVYRVLPISRDRIPPGGGELLVKVIEQPVDLEPRFIGNGTYSTEKLREWARLGERGEVYLHEAPAIRERLIAGYKNHGFHFVEVDTLTNAGEQAGGLGAPDIVFEIREGPKVRVREVIVRGNETIPDTGWGLWAGGLRAQASLKTKGKGVFRWWGGVFDEMELEADLVAMRQIYRDRGWLDAAIYVEKMEFNDQRDRMVLHIRVDEGPLWKVGSIHVEALERNDDGNLVKADLLFPEDDLLDELNLKVGGPYEAARVFLDTRDLRNYYGERGYIEAFHFAERGAAGWRWHDPHVLSDYETKTLQVIYRMEQGQKRRLREIRYKGNTHTRDKVLRREMSVEEGEQVDVREIERSINRLNQSGYFSDAQDIEHRDPYYVFYETDDPEVVDLEVRVEEGHVVNAGLAGGVSSELGLIGQVSLRMSNFDASSLPDTPFSVFGDIYSKEAFHGNGELLELDISPGSRVKSASFRYRHPDIFGTHYDRWSLDNSYSIRERFFRSHDSERQRVRVTASRLFGHDFSLGFGPAWQRVRYDSFDDDVPSSLSDSALDTEFAGAHVTMRYSTLDNSRSPRKGYYLKWVNTVYGGDAFEGDNDLWKTEGTYEMYLPLEDWDGDDVYPGFYFNLTGQVANPYGSPDDVHYSERYFLGGTSTLRGFDFRGVGPYEGDFPIGGETLLRTSLEFRYPIYAVARPGTSLRREMLRGLFFFDAGQTGIDPYEVDHDEIRASVGFGFQLTYPIPLGFNFGFPVRERREDDTQVFSFSLRFR